MKTDMEANTVIEECESTNDLARALGEKGCPAGTWISARRQSHGRGRSGREWVSRDGNLFLSLIARPKDRALWSWIPLMSAVAASEAVEEFQPACGIGIKWPNDLLLPREDGWAKVAGILCEGVASGENSYAVIGIGVNCAFAPENIDQPAARLEGISADELRPALIRRLGVWLTRLDTEGHGAVSEEFVRRSIFAPGEALAWISERGIENGRFAGIGPAGELIANRDSGEKLKLYCEEVKLIPR